MVKTNERIEKPWGWEEILDLNDRYCIKYLFIAPDQRLSLQYHVAKSETLMLVNGSAEISISRGSAGSEQSVTMGAMHPFPIPPGTIHRMRAASAEGALILEVSTIELDDVVRLDDDYGRVQA